ncbi:hypothetical protein Tco_1020934, partial [Tanacetum coccineum]
VPLQQITAPILTPPITTDAPIITTDVPESDALSVILKIKKEQAEKQKMPKYTIKSTDKAALKEYDQDSALYETMHKNKSFNRNPANYRLYHALMEALIEDEHAMDKGVANTIHDHKKSMMMMKILQLDKTRVRRQRVEEPRIRSLQRNHPPPRKPLKVKLHQKASAATKEPVEEPIVEVVKDDAGKDVQPPRPPTPDPEWNKHQVILCQPEEPWFNQMVSAIKDPLTFNDLMATPIDFSKYVLNRLKIDNLTQDLLLGPAYDLLKGRCTSSIKLEYNFQECFNALTDKLDWNNHEGDCYAFDLSKPLPLHGHPGHLTVVGDYFFNNDLEYLKSSDPKRTYTTSIMKTKAARYEIVGIEDMVPIFGVPLNMRMTNTLQRGSSIRAKGSVSVKKLHGYGHLEEVVVKRADQQLCKFKEGDFLDLHLNDIKDMLLVVVQHKLFHLNESDIVDFIVALHMFIRSLIIKHRVDDLQLVESYQNKINITAPQTLKKVQDEVHHRVLNFLLGYNKEMSRRKWTAINRKRSQLMVELIDKQMRERRMSDWLVLGNSRWTTN